MKKMMMILALSLCAPLAFAQDNNASPSQKRDDVVKAREQKQEAKIQEGVKSGSLTQPEAAKLEKGEQKIDKAEKKAMADGDMSKKEASKIDKMQNKEARKIAKKKHNAKKSE